MRPLTGQAAVVQALAERSTYLRVQIDRTGSGSWVDLSDYEDRDWIDSVDYEDNGDRPVGEATVRLKREWHDLSLSPLKAASKLNAGGVLVFPKRKLKVEVAVMPRGVAPVTADWFEVFNGRIDVIDWQSSPIEVKCRDQGGNLQDGWIETQAIYGTGAGRAIESVIQDILTAAYSAGWIPAAVTLYSITGTAGTPFQVADSPGFLITEYKQGREPVMDAVQKLARLIGYECRYRWNTGTSAFQLVLYEPVRALRARGTITISGAPTAAQTMAINGVTYTARAAGAVQNEFNIGASTTATATAIAAMLNAGTDTANLNAWAIASTVVVEWQTAGTAGNAVTFTEAMTNVTMDGAGVLGATRAGTAITTDHDFAPDMYYDVQQLSIDVADVRNAFSGTFQDAAGERRTVTRINSGSIAKYNRRPFMLVEEAASQIDTVQEMVDLLDAADNDLAEPDISHGILAPFFPWGESGDFYGFDANGVHYDTDQELAALTLRHRLSNGQARTEIVARGQPSLGPTRWLEAEGRPGVGPPPDIYADEAAQNVAASSDLGTLIVTYDDPRTMDPTIDDWAYTECHLHASDSGFTPSSSTLYSKGRVTRFEIGGLVPGATYYVKLVIYDAKGNAASISTVQSTATQRVGPYHENLSGQQDQILRNNDFNIFTLGVASPPDGWSMITGTWGTDIDEDTTDSVTGNYAMDFEVVSGVMQPAMESAFIPVGGGADTGDILQAAIVCKRSGGSTNSRAQIEIRFYDRAQAYISTSSTQFTPTTTYVAFQTAPVITPATAMYCKVRITGTYSAGVTYTLRVDRAALLRSYAMGHAGFTGVAHPFSTTYAVMEFDETLFTDGIGVNYLNESASVDRNAVEIIYPGTYQISGYFFSVDTAGVAHAFDIEFRVNTGGGYSSIVATANASRAVGASAIAWIQLLSPPVQLEKGDTVQVRYRTSVADDANRDVGTNDFAVRQIVRSDQ